MLWICDYCEREWHWDEGRNERGCICPEGLEETRLEKEAQAKFAAMTPAQRAARPGISGNYFEQILRERYIQPMLNQLDNSTVLLDALRRGSR